MAADTGTSMILWRQYIILFGGFIDVGIKSRSPLQSFSGYSTDVISKLPVGSVDLRYRGIQMEAD